MLPATLLMLLSLLVVYVHVLVFVPPGDSACTVLRTYTRKPPPSPARVRSLPFHFLSLSLLFVCHQPHGVVVGRGDMGGGDGEGD